MTEEEVLARVDVVRRLAGDDEVAHAREDDLHRDVLLAIARGECADPAKCAESALKTLEINFARWCA